MGGRMERAPSSQSISRTSRVGRPGHLVLGQPLDRRCRRVCGIPDWRRAPGMDGTAALFLEAAHRCRWPQCASLCAYRNAVRLETAHAVFGADHDESEIFLRADAILRKNRSVSGTNAKAGGQSILRRTSQNHMRQFDITLPRPI